MNVEGDSVVFAATRSRGRSSAASALPRRARLVAGAVLLIAAVSGPALGAQNGNQPNGAFQVDVSNDQRYGAGEPEIAINPKNPRNIVIAYPRTVDVVREVAEVAASFDGGHTWTKQALTYPGSIEGGDAFASVGSDGTFYAGGGYDFAHNSVWKSIDGGRTWTGPSDSLGAEATPSLVSRGYVGFVAPPDRPWITVDAQDGRVYSAARELSSGEGFVAVSSDHAQTWSVAQSFDGANFQHAADTGSSATISAARGVLAAVYAPSVGTIAVVGSQALGPGCRCVIFETSRDGGATWNRHRLPDVTPVEPALGNNASCGNVECDVAGSFVAADPVRDNHYAVMVDTGTHYTVFLTTDGGAHWAKTATSPEKSLNVDAKPWIAFSRTGVLGAMWLANNHGKLDVYATISRDGGHRFSRAIKVSKGSGPYQSTGGGLQHAHIPDDCSAIAIGTDRAYVVWGDHRNGITAVFFASVPLSQFLPDGHHSAAPRSLGAAPPTGNLGAGQAEQSSPSGVGARRAATPDPRTQSAQTVDPLAGLTEPKATGPFSSAQALHPSGYSDLAHRWQVLAVATLLIVLAAASTVLLWRRKTHRT